MKIKELLFNEKKWTQGALARDKNGKAISCLDIKYLDGGRTQIDFGKNATSWSLPGAISICYDYDERDKVLEKIHSAMRGVLNKDMYISAFNDHENTTFQDVKKVVLEAGV